VPGAVVLVGQGNQTLYRAAFGHLALWPAAEPMRPDAIFDLASLTKVVATAPAIMQLAEQGRLRLDAPVAAYWPGFAAAGKAGITVRELLLHTSGLRPDLAPDAGWQGTDAALARIAADHPLHAPGSAFLYSDLNFIVLGELVRRVSGETLDRYAARHIFGPLRMRETGFNPPSALRVRIVPTDREAGTLRRGVVQDPTAWRMGGVAGHAGLFSTADDLARFARMLLGSGALDGTRILRPETVAALTAPVLLPGGIRRALGWDMDSHYARGIAPAFGPRAYGHTGYTGTLLWIDPDTGRFLILLTSRLHPDGHGDAKPLRQEVAALVGGGGCVAAITVRPGLRPGPAKGLEALGTPFPLFNTSRGQGRLP
jgi:CubicO group peptidase (beta-lactamase class C family)